VLASGDIGQQENCCCSTTAKGTSPRSRARGRRACASGVGDSATTADVDGDGSWTCHRQRRSMGRSLGCVRWRGISSSATWQQRQPLADSTWKALAPTRWHRAVCRSRRGGRRCVCRRGVHHRGRTTCAAFRLGKEVIVGKGWCIGRAVSYKSSRALTVADTACRGAAKQSTVAGAIPPPRQRNAP